MFMVMFLLCVLMCLCVGRKDYAFLPHTPKNAFVNKNLQNKTRTLKRHLPHHLTDFGTGERLTSVTLTRRNGS